MQSTPSIPEAERQLLQKRIAFFAGAMAAIGLLAVIVQAALAPPDYLRGAGFATLVAGTVVAGAATAFGLRSSPSLRLLRVGEAAGLVVGAAVLAVMGRQMAAIMPSIVGEAGVDEGLGKPYALLVGLLEVYVALGMTSAFSYLFLVRAALVPSGPLRTLLLTALIGYPALVVMATGVLPLQPGWLVAMPLLTAMPRAADMAIWWTVATIACTLVSSVIYGLRREVRTAMQVGQYRLERKLGEGGMGVVYRAQHALLKRPTAIKLLPPHKASATTIARFEREVRHTARLTHPNTVTIFDYGYTPDGVFYYAMELLDGASLAEIVRSDGPQPAGRVIHVLTGIAGALEEAHSVGLIHRDVKPSNVILCERGGRADVPKLLDFGLVKDVGAAADVSLTRESDITGTPLYMAPEALISPSDVDSRSDIYAVGAVGYFLVTGQHVFTGRTVAEVLGHHMHTPAEPPSKRLGAPVPADLEALLLGCLEKPQGRRPQTASELLERLAACTDSGRWSEADARRWWAAAAVRPGLDEELERGPAGMLSVDLQRSLAEWTTRSGAPR